MTLGRFVQRMNTLADRLENNTATLKKQVGQAVVRRAVRLTPVDEGDARSNWQAKFGSPPQGVRPAFVPGSKLGRGEKANEAFTNAAYSARMISTPQPIAFAQTLYIVNNVRYISELNDGSSRQQAAGFVERAVDAGRRRARKGITLRRKVNFR
jgi:hypothetical protein